MGRKIKSIALLILILVMIYYQHSPVIYAEGPNGKGKEDNVEENSGEKEDENGNESSGEKEDENGNESSGDVNGGEEEPVTEYRLEISEPDGRNGYYISIPRVKIEHVSKKGTTVYCLKNGEAVLAEGRLSDEGSLALLGEGQFKEGYDVLTVFMEDENGERLRDYGFEKEFMIDTIPPMCRMSVPEGFQAWYQNETYLYVSAEDGETGSGIDTISCYCGGEFIDAVKGTEGTFLINQVSKNGSGAEITVVAADRAGHRSADTRRVFIDNSAPGIEVEGVTDYMITGREVPVSCKVFEDNSLKSCQIVTEWENTDGEITALAEPEWTNEGGITRAELILKEDGIYRMKVTAVDLAGFTETRETQVIIDSKNPVIRYVDELEGKYMKRFRWDYRKEDVISDFTTYTYQIQLDGELYPVGQEVETEGRHKLCVQAVDSAGNKAEAEAGFVVDHTPPEILFSDVEDSGIYEEEKTFTIAPENSEDEIREIWINGVQQGVSGETKEYSFTLQEKKAYEVAVKACDRAGNESRASIIFEIVPKETVFEKIMKPVRKIFTKEDKPEKVKGETSEAAKKENKIPVVFAWAGVCSVCGAGGMWWKKKFRVKSI